MSSRDGVRLAIEQRFCRHHDAGQAIPTLRRVCAEQRALYRMQRTPSFSIPSTVSIRRPSNESAGATQDKDRHAVDEHFARAALFEPQPSFTLLSPSALRNV